MEVKYNPHSDWVRLRNLCAAIKEKLNIEVTPDAIRGVAYYIGYQVSNHEYKENDTEESLEKPEAIAVFEYYEAFGQPNVCPLAKFSNDELLAELRRRLDTPTNITISGREFYALLNNKRKTL